MSTRRMPRSTARVSDADAWLRLDRQLCFALYATSLAMTKQYQQPLAALGLTYPQYLVLLALWERDGQTVGDLGAQLCLDSGTLTPLLKRMESAGWLTRRRAAEDERRVVVGLTAAGLALRVPARALPQRIGAATGLATAEVLALTAQLHELRQRLQAPLPLPPAPTHDAQDFLTAAAPAEAALSTPPHPAEGTHDGLP